jgi:DNA mismatch repair protein MutS
LPTLPDGILFPPGAGDGPGTTGSTPAFAVDLHLDEVAAALTHRRADPELQGRFYTRLGDPDAVAFRHEVFRDLESPTLRDALATFAARMRVVDEHLRHASSIALPLERQRWQLEAANEYQASIASLAMALAANPPMSRALMAFEAGLREYVGSADFTALVADTARMLADLDGVTYRMRIGENRLVVGRHDGEADYGAEVLATFARFRRSEVPVPLPVDVFRTADMNPVEAGILERVARLNPAVFAALQAWVDRHGGFLEPAVGRVAAELPFYLGWLELIRPLQEAGLTFCYPDVSSTDVGLDASRLFDLALALRRVPPGDGIVTNDVVLSAAERLVVITGPNQGGKTSFARAIGQLHHLAAIGVPVPGSAVRIGLGAGVHTLFARAEDPADLTGRLEAELTRARTILDELRPGSVVIMNESFASTTADDALALNRALIGEMTSRGATCIVVTFLGELAADDPSTASVSAVMDPVDPSRPTFRMERRPPDPLAHARAVADVHGLGYDAVRARVGGADPT